MHPSQHPIWYDEPMKVPTTSSANTDQRTMDVQLQQATENLHLALAQWASCQQACSQSHETFDLPPTPAVTNHPAMHLARSVQEPGLLSHRVNQLNELEWQKVVSAAEMSRQIQTQMPQLAPQVAATPAAYDAAHSIATILAQQAAIAWERTKPTPDAPSSTAACNLPPCGRAASPSLPLSLSMEPMSRQCTPQSAPLEPPRMLGAQSLQSGFSASGFPNGVKGGQGSGTNSKESKRSSKHSKGTISVDTWPRHIGKGEGKGEGKDSGRDGALCDQLHHLQGYDYNQIIVTRKINRLGFESPQILESYFSKFGKVEHVLVPHSHVKSRNGVSRRLRPSALGFIVMSNEMDAMSVLAIGEEHLVADKEGVVAAVRVHAFKPFWEVGEEEQ